jgi:hypothetical protein
MTTEEIKTEFNKMSSEGKSHQQRMNWLHVKRVEGAAQPSTGELKGLNEYSYSLTGEPNETELQNIVKHM